VICAGRDNSSTGRGGRGCPRACRFTRRRRPEITAPGGVQLGRQAPLPRLVRRRWPESFSRRDGQLTPGSSGLSTLYNRRPSPKNPAAPARAHQESPGEALCVGKPRSATDVPRSPQATEGLRLPSNHHMTSEDSRDHAQTVHRDGAKQQCRLRSPWHRPRVTWDVASLLTGAARFHPAAGDPWVMRERHPTAETRYTAVQRPRTAGADSLTRLANDARGTGGGWHVRNVHPGGDISE
jgi:hypothetical protein